MGVRAIAAEKMLQPGKMRELKIYIYEPEAMSPENGSPDSFPPGLFSGLFANNFRLGQLIRHFNNGAHDRLHGGIFHAVKVFKPSPLGTIRHLHRDSVAIRSRRNQFISPGHEMGGIENGTLMHSKGNPEGVLL